MENKAQKIQKTGSYEQPSAQPTNMIIRNVNWCMARSVNLGSRMLVTYIQGEDAQKEKSTA